MSSPQPKAAQLSASPSPRARHAAARVWTFRERTEHEAAALFRQLAADLAESGEPAALVELAQRAARDEEVHATHCRRIVESLETQPPLPPRAVSLGPRDAPAARRALFASVALGCVTESLSTALLLEMRRGATAPIVRAGLDVILEDEVRHGRLGWAHLSNAAERGDVSWLAPHVPAMLRAALPDEGEGFVDEDRDTLAEHGILAPSLVARIATETIEGTIRPGLARYRIT